MRSPEWHPLSPQAAHQAADRSVAGSSFSDYRGQHNTARYRILTPLGYWVYVSEQRLYHINKHSQAAEHSDDLPHLLNNPDLITPNPDESATHLYYKVYRGTLFVVAVHQTPKLRYVATMYSSLRLKGVKRGLLTRDDFLYIRGGFRWRKWI